VGSPKAGSASQPRPIEVDGVLYCRRCRDDLNELVPNDPDHPRSAYCAEHRKVVYAEQRAASKRRRKEREDRVTAASQAAVGIHVGADGAAAFTAEAVQRVSDELATLAETLQEAREAIELAAESGSNEMVRGAAVEAIEEAEEYIHFWNRVLMPPPARPGRPTGS
jgi:hypothetical protein